MNTRLIYLVVCLVLSARTAAAQSGFSSVFPQFADGKFGDGSFYRSTLIVQSYDSMGSQPCAFWTFGASAQRFTNASGQVLVPDTNNRLAFSLGSLRSQVFRSAGTNQLNTGFVGVGCNGALWNAFVLFTLYTPAGTKLGEATVFPSHIDSNAPAAHLMADQREGANLGIALANPDSRTGDFDLTIRNSQGVFVDKAFVSLPPYAQTAKFLTELFPSLPANFVGTVAILPRRQYAGPGVYAVGLRFTGQLFTTVPVTLCFSGDFCDD
jgi:hypothetical protein